MLAVIKSWPYVIIRFSYSPSNTHPVSVPPGPPFEQGFVKRLNSVSTSIITPLLLHFSHLSTLSIPASLS